jgi:hypothetical protein
MDNQSGPAGRNQQRLDGDCRPCLLPRLADQCQIAAPSARHDAGDSSSAEETRVHGQLFSGLASLQVYARAINRSPRTVTRMIRDGLPVLYVGCTPYVDVAESRSWLAQQSKAKRPPRRPGRPRK